MMLEAYEGAPNWHNLGTITCTVFKRLISFITSTTSFLPSFRIVFQQPCNLGQDAVPSDIFAVCLDSCRPPFSVRRSSSEPTNHVVDLPRQNASLS